MENNLTQNYSSEQTPEQLVVTRSLSKKTPFPRLLIVVLVSLLVIAVGGASTFVLYSKHVKPTPQTKPMATPTPIISDSTANWKRYTYPYFSFNYPNDWQVENTAGTEGCGGIHLSPQKVDQGSNTDVIMCPLLGMPFDSKPDTNVNKDDLISSKQTTIDGHNFLLLRTKPNNPNNNEVYRIVIDTSSPNSQSTSSWIIYAHHTAGQENESIDQFTSTIDQILSTFKFIDVNSNAKCSSNNDCPSNTFCDYSLPGGMGPNGPVTGQPYGSQECIVKCQSNSQCPSKQCQSYEIAMGDVINTQKGCKPYQTYTVCGCGCCGGTTPNKKCLYHSKGDVLDTIIQEDEKTQQNPQCSTMGCSIGIEYYYCD